MDDLDSVDAFDGRTLTYYQWAPNDGYPIFVLAGTPGGRLVRHVSGEYDRTGVRAITYDRPGYGGPERLPGRQVAHAAAAPVAAGDDKVTKLNELGALKEQGILTDGEFAAEKAKILAG
jgi:pimeloyl-ACP methyl ester carboxylesterase